MKGQAVTYNYISDYLFKVQAKGRNTISLDELRSEFKVSEKALQQGIFRLKIKNQLAQVRKKFYVIIPPQYSHRGMIPYTLFVDDMMKHLKREYYVGLLSAAALHGAGHQQPMEFNIVIRKPTFRNIKNQKLSIAFFTKGDWDPDQVSQRKTEAGYLNISTPELTVFDLVCYNQKIGGLNRIIPILEDLSEEIKPSVIARTAKNQKSPVIQRLGYLFDELGIKNLSEALYKSMEKKKVKEVLLSPLHKNRSGVINNRWKIIINTKLDI